MSELRRFGSCVSGHRRVGSFVSDLYKINDHIYTKYDHITPILQSLHWLPIKFRISYKILLLAYKAVNDLAPAYLTNLLSRYNPTRSLRSQNSGLLVVPSIAKSTKGGRTFSYLAPKLWNSLPDNVRGPWMEQLLR